LLAAPIATGRRIEVISTPFVERTIPRLVLNSPTGLGVGAVPSRPSLLVPLTLGLPHPIVMTTDIIIAHDSLLNGVLLQYSEIGPLTKTEPGILDRYCVGVLPARLHRLELGHEGTVTIRPYLIPEVPPIGVFDSLPCARTDRLSVVPTFPRLLRK
jgi:hypothetical protein